MKACSRFVAELGQQPERERILATILFTDIVGSTQKAADLGDAEWRDLLARHHAVVRGFLARHRGEELDTAGSGFFASFDGPGRAITCAREIRDGIQDLGLDIRAGVHTGECSERLEGKLGGLAVSIGARVASEAGRRVLVTGTVRDLRSRLRPPVRRPGRHPPTGRCGKLASLCCGRCVTRTSSTPSAPRSGSGGTGRSRTSVRRSSPARS